MQITNTENLPAPFVKAAIDDEYSIGDANYSISMLINPTQQTILGVRYKSERSEDVSDMVWKLFGKSFHLLMKKYGGKDALSEERLFMDLGGRKITGEPDYFDGKELWDWKTTKAYARKSRLGEWSKQVNAYRYLLKHYKFAPEKQFIMALYKDWRRSEAMADPAYPQKDIEVIPIEIWPDAQIEAFLKSRIALLVKHEKTVDDNLPECTDEEMWTRNTIWAVVKKGKDRAINGGVKFNEEEAKKFMAEQKKPEELEVKFRPGERARCAGYCPVSEFCSQWMKFKVENGIEDSKEPEDFGF